jgi:hypothetical protein
MCELTTMLSFAVSAASSVVGYMGQMAQYKQQEAMYEQNRKNAIAAFEDTQRAMTTRQIQEQEAAAATRFDNNLEANAAKATARVAAGESGVSGLSIEGLLAEFSGRSARANDRADQQMDWTMAQLQDEKRSQGFTAVDRINSVPRGQKPFFGDALLRIAGAGVDAYAGYRQSQKMRA